MSTETIARVQRIINSLSSSEEDAVDFTDDGNLFNALNDKFNVARVGASKRRHSVTSESLSQKWLISPEWRGGQYRTPLSEVSGPFNIHPYHFHFKKMTQR